MMKPRDYPYYLGAFRNVDVRNWPTDKVASKLAYQRTIVDQEPPGFNKVKRSIAVLEYEMHLRESE